MKGKLDRWLPLKSHYVRACEYMGINPNTNPNYTKEEIKQIMGEEGKKQQTGKLEVSEPTKNFIEFLTAKGFEFQVQQRNGHVNYVTIPEYTLGSYEGMVGTGAWFNDRFLYGYIKS